MHIAALQGQNSSSVPAMGEWMSSYQKFDFISLFNGPFFKWRVENSNDSIQYLNFDWTNEQYVYTISERWRGSVIGLEEFTSQEKLFLLAGKSWCSAFRIWYWVLAYKAALMTKPDLIFPAFSLRFADFTVLFCFRCKFSFLEKPFESSLTVAWFFWTNHNSLLRIATNEIASFCIDNRLRQMAFFVFAKVVKGRLSSNWERFWNKQAAVAFFFIV